jgi:energy-coupling factor transport system ATP-binding protein
MTFGRRAMLKKCYLVMQDVNHQLFCESVDDEVRLGMGDNSEEDVLNVLITQFVPSTHPYPVPVRS